MTRLHDNIVLNVVLCYIVLYEAKVNAHQELHFYQGRLFLPIEPSGRPALSEHVLSEPVAGNEW
jgi:hypothetical protein